MGLFKFTGIFRKRKDVWSLIKGIQDASRSGMKWWTSSLLNAVWAAINLWYSSRSTRRICQKWQESEDIGANIYPAECLHFGSLQWQSHRPQLLEQSPCEHNILRGIVGFSFHIVVSSDQYAILSKIFNWNCCRLPFNPNASMILYAAVYALCSVGSFIIASVNIAADGFYMAACLHLNVMLGQLRRDIHGLNELFRM